MEITCFKCILSLSYNQLFEIYIKLRSFYTHKIIFWEKKFSDLINWFWSNFLHKNQSQAETTQNNEKCLFYFSLRFPTQIHFWVSKMQILKNVKNQSTLLQTLSIGFGQIFFTKTSLQQKPRKIMKNFMGIKKFVILCSFQKVGCSFVTKCT